MKHTAAVFYVDALQFVLVCYTTLAQILAPDADESSVAYRGGWSAGPNRRLDQRQRRLPSRDRRLPRGAPPPQHAVDAPLHDTSYALPNYTVFGRFRFVEDDDLDDDDRGFL